MNLSERLDEARRKRDLGIAADLTQEGYVLRATVEGHLYDGRDLRSGEAMDPQRWDEVRSQRAGMELPRLGEQEPEEEGWTRPVSVFLDLTGDDVVISPDRLHDDEDELSEPAG
jgi:hypothetical protein